MNMRTTSKQIEQLQKEEIERLWRKARRIGDLADERLESALEEQAPLDAPAVSLLKLGLQRAGRLQSEKQEVKHSGEIKVTVVRKSGAAGTQRESGEGDGDEGGE